MSSRTSRVCIASAGICCRRRGKCWQHCWRARTATGTNNFDSRSRCTEQAQWSGMSHDGWGVSILGDGALRDSCQRFFSTSHADSSSVSNSNHSTKARQICIIIAVSKFNSCLPQSFVAGYLLRLQDATLSCASSTASELEKSMTSSSGSAEHEMEAALVPVGTGLLIPCCPRAITASPQIDAEYRASRSCCWVSDGPHARLGDGDGSSMQNTENVSTCLAGCAVSESSPSSRSETAGRSSAACPAL
jgi:hypothetical protein